MSTTVNLNVKTDNGKNFLRQAVSLTKRYGLVKDTLAIQGQFSPRAKILSTLIAAFLADTDEDQWLAIMTPQEAVEQCNRLAAQAAGLAPASANDVACQTPAQATASRQTQEMQAGRIQGGIAPTAGVTATQGPPHVEQNFQEADGSAPDWASQQGGGGQAAPQYAETAPAG